MKYRFIPVISAFVSFPCWSYQGMESFSSTGVGTQIEFSSASGSVGVQTEFGLPTEAGMMTKGVAFPGSYGTSFVDFLRKKPEITQTAQLTQPFAGMSVDVFRYANRLQSISFKSISSMETTPKQAAETHLSEYQQLLLLLITHVAYEKLLVIFNEAQSAFILASQITPEIKLKVPSQVDTTNYPSGSLEGLTILHHSALTDITRAWECYKSEVTSFWVQTIPCADGSSFLWDEAEQAYIYAANSPAPVPPEYPFGLTQFGFDKSWPLSGEYALLFINGKPEKVKTIGSEDYSFSGEPMDSGRGGNRSNSGGKHSTEQTGDGDSESDSSRSGRAKKKRGKSGRGGDDPEDRPTDYGRKAPQDGRLDPELPQTAQNIGKALAKIEEQLKKDEGQLDTKWSDRVSYKNAPKRREVEQRVIKLKAKQEALKRQLAAL